MSVESSNPAEEILREQQRYYSERAGEYDQWWFRQGRYDLGPSLNRVWFDEVAQLQRAFELVPFHGHVLELAGGTGIWTQRLASRVQRLTVLDGSAAMISLNRARLEAAGLAERVSYRKVDLFAWRPSRLYDAVFCGFWLSHVPADRLDEFLQRVASALTTGGTLAVVDNTCAADATVPNRQSPPEGVEITTRRLSDGRKFQIIKRFYEREELRQLLTRHGFYADVETTPKYFVYAVARK